MDWFVDGLVNLYFYFIFNKIKGDSEYDEFIWYLDIGVYLELLFIFSLLDV